MFILLLALLFVSPAHAESLSDVNKDLKAVEETIKTNKSAVGDLSTNLKKTEAELSHLKTDTASLAKKVKGTESQAAVLRRKLDELTKERDDLNARMEALKATITPMLKAGLDMARTPADLHLFLEDPAKADDTLTAHVALKSAAQATQDHLIAYTVVRDQLVVVERDLAAQKEKLDGVLETLSKDRKELTARMAEREKLAKATRSDLGEKESTIKELSKKRQRLITLLTSLKQEQEDRVAARKRQQQTAAHSPGKSRKPIKTVPKSERTLARGLPAAGYVVQRFGEADADSGLASRGIRIEGERGGVVTAPRQGEVRFTGPFRGFGNLVIIEHGNGDFSLLGGLGKTTVREGEKLGKGDPVGTLSASTRGSANLYYELRHGGEPVDPLKLF